MNLKNIQLKYAELLEFYNNNEKPKSKNYKKDKEGFKKALKRYEEICDSLDNWGFGILLKNGLKHHG